MGAKKYLIINHPLQKNCTLRLQVRIQPEAKQNDVCNNDGVETSDDGVLDTHLEPIKQCQVWRVGENGKMILQVQGRKERLKLLIKATLVKNSVRVEGNLKTRSREGSRFKRDGYPSKKTIQKHHQSKQPLAKVGSMKMSRNEKVLLPGMVEEVHHNVVKYWLQRYALFSRFDEGIKLDEESWFSVTPEQIAKHQAAHCGSGVIIDAFAGAGGNAIQFAVMDLNVIAIDIDPKKIGYARHNSSLYGVSDKIDFIVGDFCQLAQTFTADVVFLSPPWGGPEYVRAEKYDIGTMLRPKDGFSLFKLALSIAPSIAYFLPRTVDVQQLVQLSHITNPPLPFQIERNYVHNELKAVTVYYGKIAC